MGRNRSALIAALVAASNLVATEHAAAQAPPVYFDLHWCPSEDDISKLSRFLSVTMGNGCCISHAIPLNPEGVEAGALSPWRDHLVPRPQWPVICYSTPPDYEQRAQQRRAAELERAAAEAATAAAERKAADALAADERSQAGPAKLRRMTNAELCVAAGEVIREGTYQGEQPYPSLPAQIKAEAGRRRLPISWKRAQRGRITIGESTCQLYASFGRPDRENRSVGPWGTHIQHVFGGTYVYTKNGVVSSYQD